MTPERFVLSDTPTFALLFPAVRAGGNRVLYVLVAAIEHHAGHMDKPGLKYCLRPKSTSHVRIPYRANVYGLRASVWFHVCLVQVVSSASKCF